MAATSFPAAAMVHLPHHSQVRALFHPRPLMVESMDVSRTSSINGDELSLTLGNWGKKSSSITRAAAVDAVDVDVAAKPSAAVEKQQEIKPPPSRHVWRSVEVGSKWRDIQGENHWEGLLGDPIDRTLRAELIRYGEFAQITYDAFDFDPHSIYCGSCKYSRKTLFKNSGKGSCGYEVKKYLYATSNIELPKFFRKSDRENQRWSGDSNWMGYIAVCTDEDELKRLGRRDIVIAWRGTIMKEEWIDDLMDLQVIANLEPNQKKIKVESGFLSLYTSSKPQSRFNKLSVRDQMILEIKRIIKEYEQEEISITITGHSLGAALALLSAYDIAANLGSSASTSANGAARPQLVPPVTVFSFSGPRVGNRMFKKRVEELGLKVLRVVNEHDKVPTVPGVFMNEKGWWESTAAEEWLRNLIDGMEWTYYHVGQELRLDLDVSPHLQRSRDLGNHHNLEAHLHVLDGFHGVGRPFESVFKRNPALVNKSSAFLAREAYIPPSWWQDRNKGLIQNEFGEWVLTNRDEEHLPENHHP